LLKNTVNIKSNEETHISDKRERKNINLFLLLTALCSIASGICSEGYIQSYLIKLGFDTIGIRNYGFAEQTTAVATYILLARMSFMGKGLKNIYIVILLGSGILPLAFATAGLVTTFTVLYILILIAAMSRGFFTAFQSVTEYCMAPRLFSRNLYGTAVSKSAMIGGIITICISLYTGFLLEQRGDVVYHYLFCVPVAAYIISAFWASSYELSGETTGESPPAKYSVIIKTVTSSRYMKKLLPHLLRGVATGGMYYLVPSILQKISFSDSERTYFIVVSVTAAVIGNFLFMLINKKMKSGVLSLASTVSGALFMVLAVICADKFLFLLLYMMFFISNTVMQTSVPVGVLRSTPDDELSLISSMRLLGMGLTYSLSIFVYGTLLKYVSPVYIIVFSAGMYVFCGILFKRQFIDRLSASVY